MRGARILAVLGSISLVIGIIFLFAGLDTRPTNEGGTEAFNIPAGPGWFFVFEANMVSGGSVAADFTVLSGGHVVAFILDQRDYDRFVDLGAPESPLAGAGGTSGSFSTEIPRDGTYYLVFRHGIGSEGAKEVEVSVQWTMTRPTASAVATQVTIGGVALVVGVGLLVGARSLKKKAEREAPPAEFSGVVMFEEKPPE